MKSSAVFRVCAGVLSLSLFGCSDDGGSATGENGSTSGSAPVPGQSAVGWSSDFGGGRAKCSDAEDAFAGLPHVTVGSTTIYVGYDQVSGVNQDPLVARFDDGQKIYCEYHENDGPDGRAVGITWDGGDTAYVVYTIVGGGSDLEGKGGWLSAYAPGAISGGGPSVSYIGRVRASDGVLVSGSFIIAVRSENKVNTHKPKGAVTVLENGDIEFLGESAHKPIDADGKQSMDCTDYPFDSQYRLSPDLSSLVCAGCSNCVSQKPCP